MPRALQFGMTTYQFWHEDIDLIYAYEKSYYNNMAQLGNIIGNNMFNAFSLAYGNVWSKDKKIKYFGNEFPMPDMIKELTEKQYFYSQQDKKQALSIKYQKSNNAWI